VPDSTPTLVTERLRLEPASLAHTADLQRHFADWAVIGKLTSRVPWPYPDDGVARFFVDNLQPRVASGEAMAWALVLRDRGEAVGLLEWRRVTPEPQDHRGFWLAAAHHGQGLMTEAVTAMQDYLFLERDDVDHIYVMNAKSNVASRRVKEKTGARFVDHCTVAHHSGDPQTERWIVTREAWRALRDAP